MLILPAAQVRLWITGTLGVWQRFSHQFRGWIFSRDVAQKVDPSADHQTKASLLTDRSVPRTQTLLHPKVSELLKLTLKTRLTVNTKTRVQAGNNLPLTGDHLYHKPAKMWRGYVIISRPAGRQGLPECLVQTWHRPLWHVNDLFLGLQTQTFEDPASELRHT